MKTVYHLLPGSYPSNCRCAQFRSFTKNFLPWGEESGGQKYGSVVTVCLYDPASSSSSPCLWLGGTVKILSEVGTGSCVWPEQLIFSQAVVWGGLWVGVRLLGWGGQRVLQQLARQVVVTTMGGFYSFQSFLSLMKLTNKYFYFCSSFTYSSRTPAFATPFNDTAATKSHLIPFCQGYKLLRM